MTITRSGRRFGALLAALAIAATAAAGPGSAATVLDAHHGASGSASGSVTRSDTSVVSGQYWIAKLRLHEVWKITRGAGVTVAVVDSGVPASPNLGSRLLAGVDLASGGPNGRSDNGESSGGVGRISHGQNIAEEIAGDGSGGRVFGIAPAAKILPVKAEASSSSSSGSPALAAAGIRYAVRHGAQVINLSFGAPGGCDPAEGAAIKDAYQHDVIVVAAAGNAGSSAVDTPADCPGVLAVAGIAADASYWPGSNYGPQVGLANFATEIPSNTLAGRTAIGNGTSVATAFTSGEIALLRARFPKDSARSIVTRLLYTVATLSATTTGTRVNDHVGYGVPVPYSALTAKVPTTAANPIYDQFAAQLGTTPASTSSGTPASGPSSAPQSPPGSDPSEGGSLPSGSASSSGGSGIGALPIVIIVVIVLALVVIVVLVSRSRRSPSRSG